MRLKILVLLGLFLVSLMSVVSASTVITDFSIDGCEFNFEGDEISVAKDQCSTNPYGELYCDLNEVGWVTKEVGLGCAMGDPDYNEGEESCCPDNMFCKKISGGVFQCEAIANPCVESLNKNDCDNNNGCTWLPLLGEDGKCISDLTNYGCDYYNDPTECGTDKFNFGQIGIGTELSGGYIQCDNGETYTIPVADYKCKWYDDSPAGKECRVSYVAKQSGYGIGDMQNVFSCSNIYELDECIDGKQDVDWFSDSEIELGFDGYDGIPEDCLTALKCVGGKDERFCGEPTIKLPGFSLFASFASLFVIGMYYLRK